MPEPSLQSNKLRVLPVDDSTERRASIKKALTGAGCAVVGFVSSTDNLLQRVERDDPEALGQVLSAGTDCGSCVPELRRLVADFQHVAEVSPGFCCSPVISGIS